VTTPGKKRSLRTGFTTGAAAAAATKGALTLLLGGQALEAVEIRLLTGDPVTVAVHRIEGKGPDTAVCSVIKDGGDDPDVTHKAEIGAKVILDRANGAKGLVIVGGKGVGTVTRPGLEVAVGQPAINPGPRKMIADVVENACRRFGFEGRVTVEVFVPEGKKLAAKTLNGRLGIVGGISILGTTGLVRPMSHAAYQATISAALSVARAGGLDKVVLTTGRRSERFAQALWPEMASMAFVQIGDYFKMALQEAARKGFGQAILAVFFGKALKMAAGLAHTHAASAALSTAPLAEWVAQAGGDKALAAEVAQANTARQALDIVMARCPQVLATVAAKVTEAAAGFAGKAMEVRAVVLDYEGGVFVDTGSFKR